MGGIKPDSAPPSPHCREQSLLGPSKLAGSGLATNDTTRRPRSLLLPLAWLVSSFASDEETATFGKLHDDLLQRLGTAVQESVEPVPEVDWAALIPELAVLASCQGANSKKLARTVEQLIQVGYAEKDVFSVILRLQMQWFSSIWNTSNDDGPAMLFRPSQLNSTMTLAVPWVLLEHSRAAFTTLAMVLRQSILLVAACFASSFDDPLPASDPIDKDIRNSLNQTLAFVERTKSRPFMHAVQNHLRPHLQRFTSQQHSCQRSIADLGSCWIALSRTIFDLFVPDAPVDPAAIQNCATGFRKQQESLLREQIILHSRAEYLTMGNSENVVIDYLREQLEEVLGRLQVIPALPLREGVSQLHMFWSEVIQFQNQTISPAKIDALISLLGNSEANNIRAREDVFQKSMVGFCHRLDSVYPEFSDISAPLQIATLYLWLGLCLLVCAFKSASDSVSDHVSTLSSSLVAFPSVGGVASILAQSESGPLVISPFQHLLLNLASVAVNIQAGVGVGTQIDLIETAYSQAQRLWLIDRAREGEMDAAAHSLYRHKPLDFDDVGEAEMEEREFLLLFPSFEDALNPTLDSDSQVQPSAKSSPSSRIQAEEMQQLVDLHHLLVARSDPSPSGIFYQLRKRELEGLLKTRFDSITDTLDDESIPFQLALLRTRLSSTQISPVNLNKPYNFYADTNILVQTNDWEIYANRYKEHQSVLTTLIVEWRKLELACWQVLLQSQAKMFADGVAEWWFQVYDATIRGPLDVADREQQDPTQKVTDYLTTLIPLMPCQLRQTFIQQVSHAHEILCKLGSALKEFNQGLDTFNALEPSPRVLDSLLEQARALEILTDTLCVQVKSICNQVDSSSLPVLLEDERVVVASAIEHFAKTIVALELWADAHPRLRHLFAPVRSWLQS
ncbi:hypothetical protein DFH07DRAFT_967924 [Mycena maculata]|uniref:Uncharacterized protein n=1 Tax=Mycena maculata TaxID=230809 RepID=A0AAD7MVB6_9AGAR|nr:hypothetical protein DFH07DRAFT_967924 [Mycena maculata]